MKEILGYEFEFVQQLEPVRNSKGEIAEYSPQDKYVKRDHANLNKYGEGTFCKFSINPRWQGVSGVYVCILNDENIYIGQALDFAKRFNMGYGNISARCCYEGGQLTNCKMNKIVLEAAKNGTLIDLYFFVTTDFYRIEKELIKHYNPKHNVMLRSDIITSKNNGKDLKLMKRKEVHMSNKTNNPTTDEVRKYIQKEIEKAKSNGKNECILRSGVIHNDLEMSAALPTVCQAMRTLQGNYPYDILEEPPKGNGSRLVFKYKF